MPYPNEHACRLNPPGKYDKITRKNCEQKHDGKCIDVIYGIKDGKSEIQALRFKKNVWTESAARAVCKERKGTFEPAAKEKKSEDNKIERRFIHPLELRIEKQDDGKPSKLVGYAAVFNKLNDELMFFREKIAPGAFAKSLKDGDDVRALFNHDPNQVLGRSTSETLKLKENTKGLHTEIDLPDTQLGRDLETLVERGDITGMSCGFITIRDEWEYNEGKEDLRILKEVKLLDVSPVTYPAYPDTSVAVRSHELWKLGNEAVEESEGGRDSMHMRLRLAEG